MSGYWVSISSYAVTLTNKKVINHYYRLEMGTRFINACGSNKFSDELSSMIKLVFIR
jgi:hypothetical protein